MKVDMPLNKETKLKPAIILFHYFSHIKYLSTINWFHYTDLMLNIHAELYGFIISISY